MKALSTQLRNQLERAVVDARDKAEEGAWAALTRLAVDKPEPFGNMTADQRALRVQLRARARQLGDDRQRKGEQEMYRLHRECAYEQWHQMLFARFLAENHLLMHPDGVPVTQEECEELAAEQRTDGWTLAAQYASKMLPQIFRPDDPLLKVAFAPEDKQALEQILASLPAEVFTADDSLGWCYQFWQKKYKDEVNESGKKIGADQLPAVTQLFTEDYMVKFLLHNTLGAWWAGKTLNAKDAANAETEQELTENLALPGVDWEYLRFVRGPEGKGGPWRPAAGTFDGWPKTAAELKILDPCCGSGHFLVATFEIMVALRMQEEGLSAREASDAVLTDNLFGLEIDQRCCQIAAFALAFAAWKYVDAGGYRVLPELHTACVGIGPQSTEEQWLKLAEQSRRPMPKLGREPIMDGLRNLHSLFSQAPVLGSLIDPSQLSSDLITADYETLQPYLAAALSAEHDDDDTHERAVAAAGMVKAAELLASEYTLVITNVPYLGQGKQTDDLRRHVQAFFEDGKPDLSTAFVLRCLDFCTARGTTALVTPQNWWFLASYENLRKTLLKGRTWHFAVALGEESWQTFGFRGPRTVLVGISVQPPSLANELAAIDVSSRYAEPVVTLEQKLELLQGRAAARAHETRFEIQMLSQGNQIANPASRIVLGETERGGYLSEVVNAGEGSSTGDNDRYVRRFWEIPRRTSDWITYAGADGASRPWHGRELLLFWEDGQGELARSEGARIQNVNLWQSSGVLIGRIRGITATRFSGGAFDKACVAICPRDPSTLSAIYAFLTSNRYEAAVRQLDQKVAASTAAMTSVPFDCTFWQQVATEQYPNGLPEPENDDPTQWLFHGCPEASTVPLQVAVARLLGYRWPAELDEKMRLSQRARELVKRCQETLKSADPDGIVCIPAVAGEQPAADRLMALLATCGIKADRTLEDWLRDSFFEEHYKLFHQRPFVWHIWDGRKKDGFHALVNYHKLDRNRLEKLIYTYLGDWIARQKAAEQRGESGAEARRLAAEDLQNRLKLILEGESPYDIFVRWKPLHEQPVGWEPDLNDGVRMNIRPFVEASVLRRDPNIKWTKDRGKEPERDRKGFPWFWDGVVFTGERVNDVHLSLKEKRDARSEHKP